MQNLQKKHAMIEADVVARAVSGLKHFFLTEFTLQK